MGIWGALDARWMRHRSRKNAEHLGLGGSGQYLDILPNVLVSGYGRGERREAAMLDFEWWMSERSGSRGRGA